MRNIYQLFETSVKKFPHRIFLYDKGTRQRYSYLDIHDFVCRPEVFPLSRDPYIQLRKRNSVEFVVQMLSAFRSEKPFVPLSFSPFEPSLVSPPPPNTAFILYTSGTTAQPKGVVLTHDNVLSNLEMIHSRIPRSLVNHRDHCYGLLPWYHCYGLVCELLFMMSRGAMIVIPQTRDPKQYIHEIRSTSPTVLQVVPRFLEKIHLISRQHEWVPISLQKRFFFGHCLRFLSVGGGKTNLETLHYFQDVFQIPICQGYGMTEASPMISLVNPEDNSPLGSCGTLLPGIQTKIHSNGKLCIKGPSISSGYLGHPLRGEDEWFMTEDQVMIDEKDILYFQQRDSSIWKMTNGKFLDPSHIESLLLQLPHVEQAVVLNQDEQSIHIALYVTKQRSANWLRRVQQHLEQCGCQGLEIPKDVILLEEPLSIEKGTLTLKYEPKRSYIQSLVTRSSL